MTPKEPTDLDTLTAYAEGYAEFSMKNIGRVAPTMLAVSPDGLLHFIPESLADERAKNDFANIGRLICAAYGATYMVMILESWVTMAKSFFARSSARDSGMKWSRPSGDTASIVGATRPMFFIENSA